MITEEQKKTLKDNYIEFAYFEKDGKINIAFMPEKTELIKKLIYPKKEEKKQETIQQKNNRIYAQLKKNAELTGQKIGFKTRLTKAQLDSLSDTDLVFAYFINSEDKTMYNIAYDKKDDERINKILISNKSATKTR